MRDGGGGGMQVVMTAPAENPGNAKRLGENGILVH